MKNKSVILVVGIIVIVLGFVVYKFVKPGEFSFGKSVSLYSKVYEIQGKGLSKSSVDNMFRFVGSEADNYICLGTKDQQECLNNEEKYLYRIIGIVENEDKDANVTTGNIKVIKKRPLNEKYIFSDESDKVVLFNDSSIIKVINGEGYLNNSDYKYLKDDILVSANYKYAYLELTNKNLKNLYDNTIINYTKDTLVGLLSVEDFIRSINDDDCLNKLTDSCATGWINITSNTLNMDNIPESDTEWLIDSAGTDLAHFIQSDGKVNNGYLDMELDVRPVIYLSSNVKYNSGTGTLEDPFTIK